MKYRGSTVCWSYSVSEDDADGASASNGDLYSLGFAPQFPPPPPPPPSSLFFFLSNFLLRKSLKTCSSSARRPLSFPHLTLPVLLQIKPHFYNFSIERFLQRRHLSNQPHLSAAFVTSSAEMLRPVRIHLCKRAFIHDGNVYTIRGLSRNWGRYIGSFSRCWRRRWWSCTSLRVGIVSFPSSTRPTSSVPSSLNPSTSFFFSL